MKTTIKTAAALCAATVILSGITALGDDTTPGIPAGTPRFALPKPAPGDKIISTVDYYTNNQQTVANIQQSRVQQSSPMVKGASALATSSRTETRPPTAYMQADPWIQSQHPWDIQPDLPAIDEGTTNDVPH
jgi:hypothetical protein